MERANVYAVTIRAAIGFGCMLELVKLKPNSRRSGAFFEADIAEVIEVQGPFTPNTKQHIEAEARLKQKRDLLNTPLGALIHELKKEQKGVGKDPPGPESY